jgi:hypothetical protein
MSYYHHLKKIYSLIKVAGNEVGIIFTVDLVFSVGSSVDFLTGFDINFPQGAHFTFNPLKGELVDMNV